MGIRLMLDFDKRTALSKIKVVPESLRNPPGGRGIIRIRTPDAARLLDRNPSVNRLALINARALLTVRPRRTLRLFHDSADSALSAKELILTGGSRL